jgi:hypothetical protein
MTVHVGVSGVHKAVSAIAVGVSGAWKTVTAGWVGVGGVWKQFYSTVVIGIVDDFVASFTVGVNATATYRLSSGGTISGTQGTNTIVTLGTWLPSGVGADYEVKATLTPGTDTPTGSLGAFVSLGVTKTWQLVSTGPGVLESELTIEIRRVSDSVVIQTAVITMQAERS